VAREFADFPVTLEAARECLQDVFDLPGLVGLMREIAGRKVRLVEAETSRPSPFARSLLFGYVGAFLYEGDAPLAERRAAALALDSTLLGELLGRVDLRELLDPAVVSESEAQLQWLTAAGRRGHRRAAAPARRSVAGRAGRARRRPDVDGCAVIRAARH
jgi:ATP-dependent Lhr-like helicase